jgi:hypothetical protein
LTVYFGQVFQIKEAAKQFGYFFLGKSYVLGLTKIGLGYILGSFS